MTPFRLVIGPAIVAGALSLVPLAAAEAAVVVRIDKSTQTMSVAVDGAQRYSWPVSTGRAGYGTPNGTYSPQRLARTYFSKKYYNSPMPYSIFFHGGYAIHGSYDIARLGGPASHGCVRLHPSNAATLFSLVQAHGAGDTRIVVGGSNPAGGAIARGRTIETEPDADASYAAAPAPRYGYQGYQAQPTYSYQPAPAYRPYYRPVAPQPWQSPWW